MKTEFLLLAKYEGPTVPLEQVCKEYFGISKYTAIARAKSGSLPIPAFAMESKSQKSPWHIHIHDLAQHIDRQRETAIKDWVGSHAAS